MGVRPNRINRYEHSPYPPMGGRPFFGQTIPYRFDDGQFKRTCIGQMNMRSAFPPPAREIPGDAMSIGFSSAPRAGRHFVTTRRRGSFVPSAAR